ncbi:MAG: adenosylcobalamin-dependent ribonucleoside-diphosphate reductase, partial [Pyrinomonadaceae bacterium]
ISAKANPVELNTFNISVAVTDEFMTRLKAGESYALINPRTGRETGRLDARKVFDRIVESAWRNGEPGVIFIDRINRDNPTPELGAIESTNPCGEQPLLPYESCVLGSINLSRFSHDGRVNYDRLKEVVRLGVHFLDNIIDVSKFPVPQIEQVTRANRKIGLGVMGWADLLIELGIAYDSKEATDLANEIMGFISDEALEASRELARKRGPFPRWYQERIYQSTERLPQRNATITTVAPTGTISLIADCSSGIEPIYSVAFFRRSFESEQMLFVHPLFERYAREHGFYSENLVHRIATSGSLAQIAEVPETAGRLFVTTHEVSPQWHVEMQAAFQTHIDAAVSKTINFPHTATVDDVRQAYALAYERGCKGLTIYRDGSREEQVLSTRGSASRGRSSLTEPSDAEITSLENQLLAANLCPECSSILQHNGGCLYCTCGYSVCVQT